MTDSDVIFEFPAQLLREAMEAIAGAEPARYGKDTVDVTRRFVQALVDEINDGDPFCDHSVGICSCAVQGVLEELELALEGKQTCSNCGGEGVVYDEAKYNEAKAEAEKDGWTVDDYAGAIKCPKCDGSGRVPLTEEE